MLLRLENFKYPQIINSANSWSTSYPTPSDIFTCHLCWNYNLVASPYLVIILTSLHISVTVDLIAMNCQLKTITIHTAAWNIPNACCVSHFGSGIFLYVNSYVENVK